MLKKLFPGMVGLVIFLVLWEIQRADYLLFHTLTELFGVIVAGSVSILVWNARAYIRRPAFFLLGTAFGFVATFDLLHALAFPGLALLPGAAENRTAQLWLAARLVEALTLLVFVAWWDREIDLRLAVGGLAGGSLILLASILAWNNFPIAYQASLGQTPFKIGTEILILCLLLVTLYLLTTRRAEMDQVLFTPLMLGLFFSFVSEVAITYYTHMVETATVLAHFLKVASFYMFYRAMIVSGIQQPFKVLFQDLARREVELDETNRRLSQVNNRLRSVLNALPVGVIVTDSGGQVIEKNPLSDGLWGQSVVSAGISGSRRPYQAWIPVTG
ncbi:MAG TPA: MASE3 domain-containing protein, partial [Anaerolineaceae bacterium]|nr:MASE3 domain-containing protein [Anaerolineaceae bacterium]